MVVQTARLKHDRTGSRSQHGEATVNDDAFVGFQLNDGARLNDDFIGHADGVTSGQHLRARPRGLCPTLRRHLFFCFGERGSTVCGQDKRGGKREKKQGEDTQNHPSR